MGIRIYQLPAVVANQIAAGEVIERPASVVKELLENSLDAGADAITIEINYGGLNQIKISDNGVGIVADDLPLAVAAHATSKIKQLSDLYAIESMGFRGEALASIASVAKLAISSRPVDQEHAMMLQMKGSELQLSPCARTIGTTIDVSDLFFNTPVRKRFLKSERVEFQAIEAVVKRFALSAPHVAITLKHNTKLVLSLPPALNERVKITRMTKLFGSAFVKEAIFLDVSHSGMRLFGWISSPNFQRSQNDRQWIYINQRMVKDKLINHALKQAYEDLLHPGRFPACLLYFTIKNSEVDVNVHPTKHEVRFQQPRLVHDFFVSQLQQALRSSDTAVSEPEDYPSPSYAPPASAPGVREPLSSSFNDKTVSQQGSIAKSSVSQSAFDFTSTSESSWIVLNNRYILTFIKKQPLLVDVIQLQQQALYHQLMQLELPLMSRPLLVPVSYSLPSEHAAKLGETQNSLGQLGINIELQNENKILVRSVPVNSPYLDIKLFLNAIITLENTSLDEWIVTLSQSQLFDPRLLSADERMQLNLFLINTQDKVSSDLSFYKVLSIENCRMLLDV